MVIKRIEILSVDKDGSLFLRLITDQGTWTTWGYITAKGKVLNEEGKQIGRIKPEYAQLLREHALGKLRYAFTVSKEELSAKFDIIYQQQPFKGG